MLHIISRYRLLLLFWLVIGLLSAVGSTYIPAPLLKGTAAIAIGRVGIHPIIQLEQPGNQFEYKYHDLVETQSELMSNLGARYRIREAKKQLLEAPYLVEIDDLSDTVVKLTAHGSSTKQIENFLSQIIEWVLNRHNGRYDQSIQELEKQRDYVEGKMIDVMSQIVSRIEPNSIDVQTSPAEHTLQNIHSSWKDSLQNIEFSRLSLLNYRSHVVLEPTVRDKRLKPKPFLYFVTALVCSLIAFVVNQHI